MSITINLDKDSRAASDRARAEQAAGSAATVVASAGLFTIVNTVSAMADIVITQAIDYKTIKVQGYYALNDGGGGYFRWNPVSVATANNGTIFESNNSATGRWERIYDSEINVKWFGAKGDGVNNDTLLIQAAVDYAYQTQNNVCYPATDAFYNVTKPIVCHPYVSHTGLGGYAKIKNIKETDPVWFNSGGAVFQTGNIGVEYTQELTAYSCGTISPGRVVTLQNIVHASNFTVGDQVVTLSDEFTTVLGWKLFSYMHLNRVESIDGATITLKYPIDVSYAGGLARLAEVNGYNQINNVPLFFSENCVFSMLDMESVMSSPFPGYNSCYNVTFTDCIIKGRRTIYGNAYQYCTFKNIRGVFYEHIAEFAQNSIYTVVSDSKFTYEYKATYPTPRLTWQHGENSRYCKIDNCTFDLNNAVVVPGLHVFSYVKGAQYCELTNNTITSSHPASRITCISISGTTDSLRTKGNIFTGNKFYMNGIRLFLYANTINSTNSEHVFSDNIFQANSGDFSYSIWLVDAYNFSITRNTLNFGAIYIQKPEVTGNVITDNKSPLSFSGIMDLTTNDFYRNNTLRNNESNLSYTKRSSLINSAAIVTAPSSQTTDLYVGNIGTTIETRDSFKFDFVLLPIGTANNKTIDFKIVNNTDAVDLSFLSHTIASSNDSFVYVKVDILVTLRSSSVYGFVTVYEKDTDTTTNYFQQRNINGAGKDLSIKLTATVGASDSLQLSKFTSEYSNPYH